MRANCDLLRGQLRLYVASVASNKTRSHNCSVAKLRFIQANLIFIRSPGRPPISYQRACLQVGQSQGIASEKLPECFFRSLVKIEMPSNENRLAVAISVRLTNGPTLIQSAAIRNKTRSQHSWPIKNKPIVRKRAPLGTRTRTNTHVRMP